MSAIGTKHNFWTHTVFPELGANRPYHQLGDDSRPCEGFRMPAPS